MTRAENALVGITALLVLGAGVYQLALEQVGIGFFLVIVALFLFFVVRYLTRPIR